MEMEGMKRSLDLLEQNGLEVDYMVTERQPQILNHLMERKIPQFHDVWVLEKVDKILHNEAVFCDVVQMSQHNQTSFLEAFHSLIQSFAPQKVDLPFMGLLCRLYLAIMHYNESASKLEHIPGQLSSKQTPLTTMWMHCSSLSLRRWLGIQHHLLTS